MRTALPHLKATPEHITADKNSVALAYTIEGTHLGPVHGHSPPPPGRRIKARGVQIA